MSLPALIATVLGLSLTAYAVFAGADFGAGVLDLFAGRAADRNAIAATIGPVWEANHVWLIFSITLLFSAFPSAFAALGTRLLAPLTVAVLAIVLRSAALGLRGTADVTARGYIRLSRLFGAASLLAPFAFGAAAGALAAVSTGPPATGAALPHLPWAGGFALLVGGLAVALCTLLASSFIALAMARSGELGLAERFRLRGLQSAGGVIALAAAALAVAASSSPALWHRLAGSAIPLVIVGFSGALLSVWAFSRRSFLVARGAALLTAAAVLWGWFVGQAPHLIGTRLTIHTAAATHPALVAIAIASGIVLVLVLPATFLLFTVFARPDLELNE